jgi:hypothetical protein
MSKDVIRLILILDTAYLKGGIDAHKNRHVCLYLNLLKDLAQRTGVALVLLRHLSKGPHIALALPPEVIYLPDVKPVVLGVSESDRVVFALDVDPPKPRVDGDVEALPPEVIRLSDILPDVLVHPRAREGPQRRAA